MRLILKSITVIFLIAVSLFACKKDATEISSYSVSNYEFESKSHFPSIESEEVYNLTKEKIELGRFLFYDTRLSKDNSVSCASCHRQENAFSDPETFSEGVFGRKGKRQSMAIFNMAWKQNGFFWDGRVETLKEQIKLPLQDHLEMAETFEDIEIKLNAMPFYTNLFYKAFGSTEINIHMAVNALEQFVLTIVSQDSKYDRYRQGLVSLSAAEQRGLDLFNSSVDVTDSTKEANCIQCHNSATFDDRFFLNNGIDSVFDDLGRALVTGFATNTGQFKTVSLRNLSFTAPYMHDGSIKTLEEVIDHYSEGIVNHHYTDSNLFGDNGIGMELSDDQKADLLAFLKTLDDYSLISNPAYSNPF